MATDYEYLRSEPYSFGECKELTYTARVKSDAWKVEKQSATLLCRREGNEIKIYIPKILGSCKTDEEVDSTVIIYIPEELNLNEKIFAFASTMMIYDEGLQSSIIVPALSMISVQAGHTIIQFLPANGSFCFTAAKEVIIGIMETTITLNQSMIEIYSNFEDDIEMDDNEPGDEPGGEEPGGDESGGEEPGGNEPGGDEPGGNEPGGDEPGGDEPGGNEPGGDEPGGNEPGGNEPVESDPDDPHDDDNYIGFMSTSESKLNELITAYEVPTTWTYKVIRCLAYCKAWEDEEYPVYGLVGVDNPDNPKMGLIVFTDLSHNITYSGICEGSEIIIKENGVLADFFKNIPDGILDSPNVFMYASKNYDSVNNYKQVEGIFYYYDNSFRITPNTQNYGYFYPLTNKLIKQDMIGYYETFKVSFPISLDEDDLVKAENRTNFRAGVPTLLDPSTITDVIDQYFFIDFTIHSGVLNGSATRTIRCQRNPEKKGVLSIEGFYHGLKNTIGHTKDTLKLSFDEKFYEYYGGYLPSGELGTCKIRYYNMFENITKDIDGLVYFYDEALNIIPIDDNYPEIKHWYTKDCESTGEDPVVGIISMNIEFEVQKSKPEYADLSNIGDDNDVEMPDGENKPGAIVPDENYSSDFIGFVTANESKINELVKYYSLPTTWEYKMIKCVASCKAWEEKDYPIFGLVGRDVTDPSKKGVVVFTDLAHKIAYSDTCVGSEIIINDNGNLADFFVNIPNDVIDSTNVFMYKPKNFDSSENYCNEHAIFYYYDNSFRITPSDEDYRYFYPLSNRLIKQQTIGYHYEFKQYFEIPNDKVDPESRTDPNAGITSTLEPLTMEEKINASRYLYFQMRSNVLNEIITAHKKCERTATTGKISIHDLYAPIKRTKGYIKDTLKLTFNENFYDFYGGYLPSGQLGTCKILYYNTFQNSTIEINGIVYFFAGTLNIVPRDLACAGYKEWFSKYESDTGDDPIVGIISMEFEFEIQKSVPTYVNLSEE